MKPTIFYTTNGADAPAWLPTLTDALGDAYGLHPLDDRERVVSTLADAQAALLLVDGDDPDWAYWTATPKSSPATRRVPVLLITDAAVSYLQGADKVLDPAELMAHPAQIIAAHARVIDPATAEQLDCECGDLLPELAQQGVEKFNAGEFYKQHDLFEELWMATDGPVRDLYRAILQVGIAYYQIERGNARGGRKMLLRSWQWLTMLPDTCQGVDVAALRADAAAVRAELERLGEDRITEFNRALLQPVKLV